MTRVMRKMWKDLSTPDDFRRNWYGGVTNQCGHILAGVIGSILFLCASREFAGEMPPRWMAAVVLCLPYSVLVEGWVQGWKGADSVADTGFYMAGVLGALLPFREVSVDGALTIVAFDHRMMAAVVFGACVALFAYAYTRAERELREIHT